MKPKILVVNRGAKFSKNYNTYESHVSLTVELDEKEDMEKAYEETAQMVGDFVVADLQEQILDMKALAKKEGF